MNELQQIPNEPPQDTARRVLAEMDTLKSHNPAVMQTMRSALEQNIKVWDAADAIGINSDYLRARYPEIEQNETGLQGRVNKLAKKAGLKTAAAAGVGGALPVALHKAMKTKGWVTAIVSVATGVAAGAGEWYMASKKFSDGVVGEMTALVQNENRLLGLEIERATAQQQPESLSAATAGITPRKASYCAEADADKARGGQGPAIG